MAISNLYPATCPSLNLDFANVKNLDPRITFTRASTATYYDGVTTAKAEENLLIQSQTFSSSVGATATNNATTAPDGASTAATFIEDVSNGVHTILTSAVVFSAIQYTFSFFAKPSGRNWVALRIAGTTRAWFDVTNGVVGTIAGGVTASIVATAQGYYRCIATFTAPTGSHNLFFRLGDADNSDSYLGLGVSGVNIWGVQVEQRSSVTAYTPTTTQPITNYIPVLLTAPAGVARFEHNPTTSESLGLEIEEQRTNLLLYSEQFDNAAWIKSELSVTANTIVSPNGTLDGDAFIENTAVNVFHATTQADIVSGAAGVAYTLSIYAKPAGRNSFVLQTDSGNFGLGNCTFNVLSGTAGSLGGTASSPTIVAVGNGWYRCSIVVTSSSSFTAVNLKIILSNASGQAQYTGDGYSGLYFWATQIEAGAFPTSYIPTVASQVTRSADLAAMTGTNFSSWYNQGEGSFVTEVIANHYATTGAQIRRFVNLQNDANTEIIRFGRAATTAISFRYATNGTLQIWSPASSSGFGTIVPNNPDKFAAGYSSTIPSIVLNGTKASDITSGFVGLPTGMTQMSIGSAGVANLTDILNGTIKKIAYYPKRISNTNLQALTT